MKKLVAGIIAGAMLLLCCSCGAVYDSVRRILEEEGANRPGAQESYDAPAPEYPEAWPTVAPDGVDEGKSGLIGADDFDRMVDTEGLVGRQFSLSKDEAAGSLGYVEQEDGTYAKEATLMGRDGVVRLGFNIGGKNDYVDYSYSGSTEATTASMIAREFGRLHDLLYEKYGKATAHVWALSATNSPDNLYEVGEFDDEDITTAIEGKKTAIFQYAWRRVGDNIAYIYLTTDREGTYTIGFTYDSRQRAVPLQTLMR